MQAMQCSSVVLPEPLGPISPTTWPGKTCKSMSRSASTRAAPSPKCLERCSTRTTACLSVSAIVLPRRRQRFGRVDLEREPNAERAGGKTDHHRDDEHNDDALGVEHQPARKIRLEDHHQRQPGEEAEDAHR